MLLWGSDLASVGWGTSGPHSTPRKDWQGDMCPVGSWSGQMVPGPGSR